MNYCTCQCARVYDTILTFLQSVLESLVFEKILKLNGYDQMINWSLKEGLRLHAHSIITGLCPTVFISNHLISLYSKHGLLPQAQHLFDKMPERNVFSWNAIVFAHINNQDLSRAQSLFDTAPVKDTVTYNSMISGYAGAPGFESQAVQIFSRMQDTGTRIDEFTLTTMLNLTAKVSVFKYGLQLHTYMVKTANDSNGFAVSSLIDMYSKCGCFEEAFRIFNGCDGVMDLVSKNAMIASCCRQGELEMALELFWRNSEVNDSVSWNTLISGFAQNGCAEKAMSLFFQMKEHGLRWNEHSFTSVLSSCSGLKSLKQGKEVHAWVLKNGLASNPYINSGIVDMYCKCENLTDAESVHEAFGKENVFSITSLIVGYSLQGNMVEARKLFDSLLEKNAVVWTALFSGYIKSQQFESVFELLREFRKNETSVPDALIIVSVLCASSVQAALEPGKQIHSFILRNRIEMDEKLSSSIVDMYAKCGEIKYAEQIFQRVSNKDRVLYNTMISGYANHGFENKAISLFERMVEIGIIPDVVTFIALLSACRHAGLVDLGEKYFDSMTIDYGLAPEIDHYSCMVDLYGRGNCLDKAMALMRRVPLELDVVIWGAFLNACRTNRNIKLARIAEDELLRLEVDNGARYVQLANVYAAEGEWSEMSRVRKKMRSGEVQKLTGCSWVYVENKINIFTSGDRSHSQADTIYSMLDYLMHNLEKQTKL